MDAKEIDNLFKIGLEYLKKGKYAEAEAFFTKAKKMTLELQELRKNKI